MRVVGVDLGSRRIGVAVSDPSGTIASPLEVLERSGDAGADRRRLAELVRDVGAERVVVGLPLSLDGTVGPAARWAGDEAEALRGVLDVPLELHDERLTTVSALRARGTGRNRRGRGRRPVDDQAAAVMLQSWLDGHPVEPRG